MGTSLISNCLRELKKLRPTVTKQQHCISAHFLHRHEAIESGVGNAFRGCGAGLQAEQGAAATNDDGVTTIHFDDVIDIGSGVAGIDRGPGDRKSTRLNSSHSQISYAVFCLEKK